MTNPIKEKEIELLKDIREYTFNNKELLNAHHFMFACPVKRNGNPADIIICGINPGGDPKGKDYRKIYKGRPFPTEESSDYDWWVEDYNKSRLSSKKVDGKYLKCAYDVLGSQKNITLTEAFFWNSTSVRKEHFDERYGYSLDKNPHWDFCVKMNLELFKAHNPDCILVFKSNKNEVPKIAKRFNLNEIYSFYLDCGKRSPTKMYHYETDGSIPFIFVPHPSGYIWTPEMVKDIKKYLYKIGVV